VPKRPRFSRWRRLPPVFRTGEHRPDSSGTELDRIILYVPARILDLAEALAEKAGVASIQDYCGLLLMQAIENERVRQRIAGFESRRGPLEGLKEIADDPDYLAEWQKGAGEKPGGPPGPPPPGAPVFIDPPPAVDVYYPDPDTPTLDVPARPLTDLGADAEEPEPELDSEAEPYGEPEPAPERQRVQVRVVVPNERITPPGLMPMAQLTNERSAAEVLSSHVAMNEDEWGFLPCLRRGEAVPAAKVAELEGALLKLEQELRGKTALDRRIAHALYRLALESQVLLTDAWPGVFDGRVIQAIRTVQEAVERILSDQDVRFYAPTGSERPH
jgi:hypothetical protein